MRDTLLASPPRPDLIVPAGSTGRASLLKIISQAREVFNGLMHPIPHPRMRSNFDRTGIWVAPRGYGDDHHTPQHKKSRRRHSQRGRLTLLSDHCQRVHVGMAETPYSARRVEQVARCSLARTPSWFNAYSLHKPYNPKAKSVTARTEPHTDIAAYLRSSPSDPGPSPDRTSVLRSSAPAAGPSPTSSRRKHLYQQIVPLRWHP
jgi:hypothetical protein